MVAIEFLLGAYLVTGLLAYIWCLGYIDRKNKEKDPEGFDVILALLFGIVWPITVPSFILLKVFVG